MGGIIWLASYPKSGNTWMRAFLHNLMRNPDRPIEPSALTALTLGDGLAQFYQPHSPRPTVELSHEEIARLRPLVQRDLTRRSPDSVFVKTHNWLGEDHGVPCISMEYTAGAIYIVRNPLDVVISLADHFGLSIDGAIERMADPLARTANAPHRVPDVMSSWSNHVRSWTQTPSPRLHVIRYEDMLNKPLQAFGGVVRFLGLKPSRERLQKAIDFSSFGVLQKLEAEKGFTERSEFSERFFRKGRSGQWRDVLSEAQQRAILETHGEQMARFGYGATLPAAQRAATPA